MQTFIVHSLKKLFRLLVLLGFILPLFCAFLIIVRLNDCWKRQLTTGRDSRTYGQLFFYNAKAGQFAISIRGTYFLELSVAFEIGPLSRITPQGCCFNWRRFPLRVVWRLKLLRFLIAFWRHWCISTLILERLWCALELLFYYKSLYNSKPESTPQDTLYQYLPL